MHKVLLGDFKCISNFLLCYLISVTFVIRNHFVTDVIRLFVNHIRKMNTDKRLLQIMKI